MNITRKKKNAIYRRQNTPKKEIATLIPNSGGWDSEGPTAGFGLDLSGTDYRLTVTMTVEEARALIQTIEAGLNHPDAFQNKKKETV